MSDVAAENVAEVEEPKGGRKKLVRMIGLAVAAVALVGALAFGASMLMGEEGPPAPPQPVFLDLPEMTVNLASAGDRSRYLRVSIALELPDAATEAAIDPVMPRVLDAFQVYLRELRPSDLSGSAGIQRLKEELVRRVNLAIYPAEITGVAFKEIVVQ